MGPDQEPGDDAELTFGFMLAGSLALTTEAAEATTVAEGGSWAVPPGAGWTLTDPSADAEFLLVRVGSPR